MVDWIFSNSPDFPSFSSPAGAFCGIETFPWNIRMKSRPGKYFIGKEAIPMANHTYEFRDPNPPQAVEELLLALLVEKLLAEGNP